MQFRKQANRFQLIRYSGYSKEKKRAVTELIGSIPSYAITLAHVEPELMAKLTADELDELKTWLSEREKENNDGAAARSVRSVASQVIAAAAAIDAGHPVPDASTIYAAMAVLTRALKKAGHAKPKPAPKAKAAAPGQPSLL